MVTAGVAGVGLVTSGCSGSTRPPGAPERGHVWAWLGLIPALLVCWLVTHTTCSFVSAFQRRPFFLLLFSLFLSPLSGFFLFLTASYLKAVPPVPCVCVKLKDFLHSEAFWRVCVNRLGWRSLCRINNANVASRFHVARTC